jgi:hypothetical protein
MFDTENLSAEEAAVAVAWMSVNLTQDQLHKIGRVVVLRLTGHITAQELQKHVNDVLTADEIVRLTKYLKDVKLRRLH